MKLVFWGIQQVFEIKNEMINSLVIENPRLMYNLVDDLRKQLDKLDGRTVLSMDDQPIEIAKHMEMITDIYGLNMNSKALMTKILDVLEKKAVDEVHYERTQRIIAELYNYLEDLTWDMDCNLICSEIYPKQLFRAMNFKIDETEGSLAEKLLQYIELIRNYLGEKLFVFVNFRGFIDEDKFSLLANTLVAHEYRVLFIDNREYPKYAAENRLIIDVDLCEI